MTTIPSAASHAVVLDDGPEVECAYCGVMVPAQDPAHMDADDWTAESGRHRESCEWVATRAHATDTTVSR